MDTISWFLATLHQFIGHDKTAAVIGQPPGDKDLCLMCAFEQGLVPREVVTAAFAAAEEGAELMNEQERAEWNAAVQAAVQDPTPENIARRDALRERFLTGVHERIMTGDRYQDRTH